MQKVRVYKNLHNGRYSIQHKGLVLGHALVVWIRNPSFVVNESGRQRVIKEQKKNVHAFVEGELLCALWFDSFKGRKVEFDRSAPFMDRLSEFFTEYRAFPIRYNPYTGNRFMVGDFAPIERASLSCLHNGDGVRAWGLDHHDLFNF